MAWSLSLLAHALLGASVARRGRVVPTPEPALEMEIVAATPTSVAPVAATRPRGPDDDAPPSPAPRAPIDLSLLSLGALSARTRDRLGGPAPPETPHPAARGRPSVDELRATLERAEDAVANVERGRVDPLAYDILRGARQRFQDEARRMAQAIALGPGRTLNAWGRGYLKGVETAKSTGERPPSDAALDRLALDSFTHAALARPVPRTVRPGIACYELRISAYRMPPLPFVSCGFDLDGVTCAWPFKKVTNVSGHLLSVDYGASPSTSLLRHAR